MAVNMNLLGDDFEFNPAAKDMKNQALQKIGRPFQKDRRLLAADAQGTGFLQERMPFEDIDNIIDPQRRLSLEESTVDFGERRRKLFEAFDTIRTRRGVSRSGFTDFAEQQALRDLARERRKTLFANENKLEELRSSLMSQNDQVTMRNRQKLFDVFGDDIYNSIRSLRENR